MQQREWVRRGPPAHPARKQYCEFSVSEGQRRGAYRREQRRAVGELQTLHGSTPRAETTTTTNTATERNFTAHPSTVALSKELMQERERRYLSRAKQQAAERALCRANRHHATREQTSASHALDKAMHSVAKEIPRGMQLAALGWVAQVRKQENQRDDSTLFSDTEERRGGGVAQLRTLEPLPHSPSSNLVSQEGQCAQNHNPVTKSDPENSVRELDTDGCEETEQKRDATATSTPQQRHTAQRTGAQTQQRNSVQGGGHAHPRRRRPRVFIPLPATRSDEDVHFASQWTPPLQEVLSSDTAWESSSNTIQGLSQAMKGRPKAILSRDLAERNLRTYPIAPLAAKRLDPLQHTVRCMTVYATPMPRTLLNTQMGSYLPPGYEEQREATLHAEKNGTHNNNRLVHRRLIPAPREASEHDTTSQVESALGAAPLHITLASVYNPSAPPPEQPTRTVPDVVVVAPDGGVEVEKSVRLTAESPYALLYDLLLCPECSVRELLEEEGSTTHTALEELGAILVHLEGEDAKKQGAVVGVGVAADYGVVSSIEYTDGGADLSDESE